MSELVIVPQHGGGLMPVMSVQQASERYNVMVEFTKSVMVQDQDFGIIPGVQKPCLYKAGAEKLSSLFGFMPSFQIIERTEDWTGKDHNGEPFFFYFYKCQLLRGGEIVGEGDGSCNSWEKKYRYRGGERKCPNCGKATIIVGKEEYGGGFLCFAKKGGCGAKFLKNDASITGQQIAQVPNPDIAEVVNTLQKMAQKRALVAAVLIACNASAFYTQDVEDMRTIDVDYREVPGTREAQKDVAQRKIHDLTPTDTERKEALGIVDYEQRHAAKVSEAIEALKPEPKPERKRGTIPLNALKMFREAKSDLHKLTGSDQLYYDTLSCAGVGHADELDTDQGRKVYKSLVKICTAKRQEAELTNTFTEYTEQLGVDQFTAILGANGCVNVTEAMQLGGTPLNALLNDLKQAAADRVMA